MDGLQRRRRNTAWLAACSIAAVLGMIVMPAHGADAAAPPGTVTPSSWLEIVNLYRALSDVAPVTEDPSLSPGAYNHSCYMLHNGMLHDELPGNVGYTPDGDAAGNGGNIAVSTLFNQTALSHIDVWMAGPFHAIGVLRPNLRTVGWGKCDIESTEPWRSAATLDISHGLEGSFATDRPIVFPGEYTTVRMTRLPNEVPNPLDFCGWTGPAGMPLVAMMPERITAEPQASLHLGDTSIEVCVLSQLNTSGAARKVVDGTNAVIVVPRSPLAPGHYSASVSTPARTVTWSFAIDPTTATPYEAPPLVAPPPVTAPISTGLSLEPVSPARILDTRTDGSSPRLVGGVQRRIQVAGRGGVPNGAWAVTANFTIANPAADGYLTVWNCAGERPVVSTLNFSAGETVPNGATVALDHTGGLCVYSVSGADLLVDVTGAYTTKPGGGFQTVASDRLLDSRIGLGTAGRLAANSVTSLRVTDPGEAAMVTLNVTSILPSDTGFVTVYPCDMPRPEISSLNPEPGNTTANLVVTPVAGDGTICLYAHSAVDLLVDLTGFITSTAAASFSLSTPFRLIDTRDPHRVDMQAGTGGRPVMAGQTLTVQVAGTRGIAADATAVSANVTVTDGQWPGFVTAWPCGPQPTTSVLNFVAADPIANGAQLPLSADGKLCIFVSSEAHVVLDVTGWWS